MAQGKTFNNSNFLKSPPSIHGPEVSAHWTRTKKGEVLVTMKMPRDTVDLEIYSKTPQGHSGVQMDPWQSSTWRRQWDKHHTPNNSTKQKLKKYKQQKAHRGISLHQTAGRGKGIRNTFWSPRPNRPNPRALGLICDSDHKDVIHRQGELDKVRYEVQHSSHRKRPRQESLSASHEDLPLVLSSDEEDLCVVDFKVVPMPDKEDPKEVNKDVNSRPNKETTH